jgi:hypothetical protein
MKGEAVNPSQFTSNVHKTLKRLGRGAWNSNNMWVKQTDNSEVEGGAYVILSNKVDICIRNLRVLYTFNLLAPELF